MRRCWLSGANYNVDVMSRSGLKGSSSIGWLAAISTSERCRATCSALTVFGQLSAAYGGKPSSGAASVTGSSGHALVVSQVSKYRNTEAQNCTSLSGGTLRVTDLRQEPHAVAPRVRICAGGAGNCYPYRDRKRVRL